VADAPAPNAADIEICRADASHEPEILALATRTLGWGDDDRYADLYRWKHDQNPVGPSPRWVAVADGRVVGFRVLMRWEFRTPDGSLANAVRAVDTATDPDFQGRGIFRSLTLGAIDELRDEGLDLVFNTPNDQSRPGYLKMGWTELGRPPIAVVPRLRSLPRIAKSRAAAELWSEPTDAGTAAIEHFADARRSDAIDALVEGGDVGTWHTARTAPWLAWRYGLRHLHYRVLTTDDLPGRGTPSPGLVVFRLRRRGLSLEATVTELLATAPATRRALLRAVVRSTGADYALVASSTRVDATPSVRLGSFSPLVTWRRVSDLAAPTIDQVRLGIGDLELF